MRTSLTSSASSASSTSSSSSYSVQSLLNTEPDHEPPPLFSYPSPMVSPVASPRGSFTPIHLSVQTRPPPALHGSEFSALDLSFPHTPTYFSSNPTPYFPLSFPPFHASHPPSFDIASIPVSAPFSLPSSPASISTSGTISFDERRASGSEVTKSILPGEPLTTTSGLSSHLSSSLSSSLPSPTGDFPEEDHPFVKSPTPPSSNSRKYKCLKCSKSFTRKDHLISHDRIHTGEKPFKCTLCGKDFSQLSHLRLHIRRHLGERPFKCPVPECGSAFTTKGELGSHVRSQHEKKRPDPSIIDISPPSPNSSVVIIRANNLLEEYSPLKDWA